HIVQSTVAFNALTVSLRCAPFDCAVVHVIKRRLMMENANCYEAKKDNNSHMRMPNVVINCLNLSGSVDIPYESNNSFEPSNGSKLEEANGGINNGTSSDDNALKVQPSSDNESDGSLEWSCEVNMARKCAYCRKPYKQPRLLECLHSFCEKCIIALLESKDDKDSNGALEDFQNESKTPPGVATNIGNDLRWVKYLKPDFIKANLVTAAEFKQMILSCESCKAEEPAMARCMECSCFLCISCINAHKYMKCFDGHEVVSFEDLKVGNDSFVVHRPVYCQGHTGEPLKYFCVACNEAICVQCARLIHASNDHRVEMLKSEHGDPVREQLQELCFVAQSKVGAICWPLKNFLPQCSFFAQEELLQNAASDVDTRVQLLRDNVEAVRSEIEEHFECCLQTIRNARDNVLEQLERTETDTEGQIMESYRKMRNTMEKISDACIFTNQLLKYGSALELIISGKIVSSQLIQLAHSIPNVDASPSIVFVKESQLCESALTRLFGFVTVDTSELGTPELSPSEQFGGLFKPADCDSTVQLQKSSKLTSFDVNQQKSPIASSPHSSLLTDGQSIHGVRSSPNSLSRSLFMESLSPVSSAGNFNTFAFGSKLVKSTNDNMPHQNNYDYMRGQPNRDCLPMEPYSVTGQDEVAASDNFPTFLTANKFCMKLLSNQNSTTSPYQSSSNMAEREVGDNKRPYGMVDSLGLAPCINSNAAFNMHSGLPMAQSDVFAPLSPLSDQSHQFKMDLMNSPPPRSWTVPLAEIKTRFGSNGSGCGQFDSPHGFCISNDDDLIVADSNNHRIQVLSSQGFYKYHFGVAGRADGHLWYPRKVALSRDNKIIIVCDRGIDRSRMQFFSRNGTFLKSVHIRFAEIVAGLAVDEDDSIVIVDSVKPTVYCIAHSGDVSRWFTCQNMLEPSDLAIYQRDYFICDFKGHAVYVFTSAGTIIRRIGSPLVTPFPSGIVISPEGRVLVGDSHGNHFHVAIFLPTGGYVSERECISVKVSRCSGLQFTKEGCVVTLVKNNHCILILNPLN
ncbi:hypothetical protein M513_00715, partial [Trichuris suis]